MSSVDWSLAQRRLHHVLRHRAGGTVTAMYTHQRRRDDVERG